MATLESLASDVAYLKAALDELLRRAGGVTPQEPTGTIGPGRTAFKGGWLDLIAPLAADWEPGQPFYVFIAGGNIGADPTNALPGDPPRSPAGYPLFYPIGFDASGKRVAVGAPRVLFNGQSFANDAEVEAHKAWLKTQPPAGTGFSPTPR